jgi:hypothetical protein
VTVKVKVGQTRNIRLVAAGEKRPVIVPDSIVLGIDTVGQYVARIDGGQGIVVFPENNIESANLVISHAITTTEVSSNNALLEFIRNASIDQFGHITSLVSTGLDANNFISANNVISSKQITFGNTAINLGGSTDEFTGLNLLEVGSFTISANTIFAPDNINFNIANSDGVINAGIHRIVNVEDPINNQDVVNKRYLEVELERVENTVKVVSDPILPTDAANKRYVDGLVQGLVVRPSAHAATTADLGGVFESGNSTVSSTITLNPVQFLYIDDVTAWNVGDNILVKDQTNPLENGSYDLIQKGNANTAWIFQRTEWSNQSSELPGSFEFVTDGTVNGGTGWVATVADASNFVINQDAVTWTQFSGEGTFTAGQGLTLTGRQFSVNQSQILSTINPANNALIISGTGALKIPVGSTLNRPTASQGMIRYNTTDGRFEAYDGLAWTGLGGVVDVDQNTKITAENFPGANNNELKFFANGTLSALFNANTAYFYGNVDVAGNVNIGGNITIGNANTDTVSVVADFTSDLNPDVDRTYNLGSESKNWSTLNVDTIRSSDQVVKFNTTGALKLPAANTALRPTGPAGMLRFNTDESRFEGWDGTIWSGLAGSVIDLDRNTYIIAETSAGANNNELDFVTDNVQRMQIGATGDLLFGAGLDKLVIDFATGDMFVNGKLTANSNLILDPVGYISVANNTITDLADPVNPGDAVNLNYLNNEFASGLTIIDNANTYVDGINLLQSPTIEIGRGLELQTLSSANNSFKIGLDRTGVTPGVYGNDNFVPRVRITEDGRIDFATEIPIELVANAIPDFTETSRDIIALMFTDGVHQGVTFFNNDPLDRMDVSVNNFDITLTGAVTGTATVNSASNTTITTSLVANYLSSVTGDANSGIIVTHTPGPNTVADLDLNFTYLNTLYVPVTGGTYTGNISAPRFVDSNNTSFYMDPNGTSRINDIEVGFGGTFSQIKMRDGSGTFSTIYGSAGKVGFLNNSFNYAAYSERATGNWVVDGDVRAKRFVDADSTTYFVNPAGTDTLLRQITVQDKITVSSLAIGGDVGTRTIKTTAGILTVDGSGGISLQGAGNDLNVNNSKITNLLNPTSPQDAATKSYVDAAAQGLRVIPAALAATTTHLNATFSGGAGILTANVNGVFTIDDVTTFVVGSRVLVKNQINAIQNGSYVVTDVGSASTPWVLTRGTYFNESSEIPGSFQFVTDGTLNRSTGWVATVTDAETFTIAIDPIVWYQFSGAGTYTAGEALTLTGTEFSISDGDIENIKLANPSISIAGEAGANTSIALGATLIIEGTDGVNTTISNGKVSIAVDVLDGGTF